MTHVATLICNPAARALDDAVLKAAGDAIAEHTVAEWIKPGIAADIRFTPEDNASASAARESLGEALKALPIDIVVQPIAHRRKALLVADMDSTMIGQE